MIKNAQLGELIEALGDHSIETEDQVTRLQQVFQIIGKRAVVLKCEAIEGLINGLGENMNKTEPGPIRDVGIICTGQKIEHYKMALYGTLRLFAEALNFANAACLLNESFAEEKTVDTKL